MGTLRPQISLKLRFGQTIATGGLGRLGPALEPSGDDIFFAVRLGFRVLSRSSLVWLATESGKSECVTTPPVLEPDG